MIFVHKFNIMLKTLNLPIPGSTCGLSHCVGLSSTVLSIFMLTDSCTS